MTNPTLLIIAGVGPGNPELVTLDALHEAEISDVIIAPRSKIDEAGIAERIMLQHFTKESITPLYFPMIRDSVKRDEIIRSQIEDMKEKLEGRRIFFPVIGDSVLYSTGAYFLDALREIMTVDVKFIPGISAHSVASSCAKRFLAMSDEILTIIPGTASPEKIAMAMEHSDAAAIYKPTAIHDIRSLIDSSKFSRIIRVEHAGIPERERILEGEAALNDVDEYISVIILHR
ncbi:MAG: precorrin-2 C(20)-methyltransferase [Synergistaceae bacterium]|nr:precorrin-2 C(20)-methyltransferase [Synergistaceae bacterium]MBR0249005.1 precorrin-2 C(20)-methyltransferase [Synergistaceae bacterium]